MFQQFALKCMFWRIFTAAFCVCPEPQADTAELLKSNIGTTCNKLDKLKGLQGWQQGRRGGLWAISRFYLSPLRTWALACHTHAPTHTHTQKHTRTQTHAHPGGIPNSQPEEQLSMTGHILHTANGWLGVTHSHTQHTHTHLEGSVLCEYQKI